METDEVLESGYGRATPIGDNLCNDFAQSLADGYVELTVARGNHVIEEPELEIAMSDAGSPSLFVNAAVVRRPLSDEEWRVAAERMHEFYGRRPGGPWLLFSAWPTPDLRKHDFGTVGHPPLMLRMPTETATTVAPIEHFELRPVNDATTARDWEWAYVHGFPDPSLHPFEPNRFLPERTLTAPSWRHWVGYLDGQPVSTASSHRAANHVHVEYISTIESARRRGIGAALVVTATSTATDLPAMLIASDLGRPVYSRLGFQPILRFTLWEGQRRA